MTAREIMSGYLDWLDQAAFFARDGGRHPDVLAAEWLQAATSEQKRTLRVSLTLESLVLSPPLLDHCDERTGALLDDIAERIADLSASQWEGSPDTPLLVMIAADIRENLAALGSVKRLYLAGNPGTERTAR